MFFFFFCIFQRKIGKQKCRVWVSTTVWKLSLSVKHDWQESLTRSSTRVSESNPSVWPVNLFSWHESKADIVMLFRLEAQKTLICSLATTCVVCIRGYDLSHLLIKRLMLDNHECIVCIEHLISGSFRVTGLHCKGVDNVQKTCDFWNNK